MWRCFFCFSGIDRPMQKRHRDIQSSHLPVHSRPLRSFFLSLLRPPLAEASPGLLRFSCALSLVRSGGEVPVSPGGVTMRADGHWSPKCPRPPQMTQVIALVGSLFQGIAYQPVILLIIALQCGLWTYLKRCEEAAAEPRSSRRRAASASAGRKSSVMSDADQALAAGWLRARQGLIRV